MLIPKKVEEIAGRLKEHQGVVVVVLNDDYVKTWGDIVNTEFAHVANNGSGSILNQFCRGARTMHPDKYIFLLLKTKKEVSIEEYNKTPLIEEKHYQPKLSLA